MRVIANACCMAGKANLRAGSRFMAAFSTAWQSGRYMALESRYLSFKCEADLWTSSCSAAVAALG